MDSDEGKLFVGGIAWDTTEETLRDHFSQYGDVSHTVIMRDKTTGRPRGFGFIVFSDPSILDRVLLDSHSIDGRTVEAKRALSREEQQTTSSRSRNFSSSRGGPIDGVGDSFRTKKIFVGGLPATITEDGFRLYFENFGQVADAVIMYDQSTQRPRGFGFITFGSEDSVDRALHKAFHDLDGKLVEVKRAMPKDSGNNVSLGNGRTEGNRYPASAYIGYGVANYGGFGYPGIYGVGGYGAGAYGMPEVLKNSYSANAGFGGGNFNYGYGSYSDGYGAAGGNSGNSSGGNVGGGGEHRRNGGSYMGSGYGDTNSGYGNDGWRFDPSHGFGGYDYSRQAPHQ